MLFKATTENFVNLHETVVLPLTEEQVKEIKKKKARKPYEELISHVAFTDSFKGEKDQLVVIHPQNKVKPKHLIVVGLGKQNDLNIERIRCAYSLAVKNVKAMKVDSFAAFTEFEKLKHKEVLSAVIESIILSNYSFDKYKTEKKDEIVNIKKVGLLVSKMDYVNDIIAETQIICNNTNFVRDLQNENADIMTTLMIEKIARDMAKKQNLKIRVFDEKELRKLNMNLILAVGMGSKYPPRFIILEYSGNPSSKDTTAILGKGITFDSGGLNLKPTKFIENMRSDMSGAAVVLGIIKTAAELKLRKNIIGVIPAVENIIGSGAYKPGDVYISYSGKSVEIGNTDAEGRLILADALAYTEKKLKPARMIDFATLTGAILIALGDNVAGMMGTDKQTSKKLFEAGEKTFERVWELPLYEEYSELLKSEIADVNNVSSGYYAGSLTGGAFLKNFVEKTPWTHIDIAGTAWLEKSRNYIPKNGTGYGVRLMVEFLKSL